MPAPAAPTDTLLQTRAYRSLLAALAAGASLESIADLAASWAMKLLATEGASVTHVRGDNAIYVAAAGSINELMGSSVELGDSFTGSVLQDQRARIFDASSSSTGSQARASRSNIQSGIVAPIMVGGRPAGTIGVVSPIARRFDQDALAVLEALAEFIALGLERHQARREFKHLVEHSPNGVAICRAGRLVYCNPTLVTTLGAADAEELLGRELADLFRAGDQEEIRRWLESPPQSGSGELEARIDRRPGDIVVVRIAPHRRIQYEGELAEFLIIRDVTEQRRVELQLVQADRLAAIGAISSSVAHEINNFLGYTLTNIDVAFEALSNLLPGGLEEAQQTRAQLLEGLRSVQEILADARVGAHQVRRITRGLRAFARADRDVRALAEVPLLVETALKMASNSIRHRARVVQELEPVPPVMCNEGRMIQVFLNLLVNAGDAIGEDYSEQDCVTVRTRRLQGQVLVEVEDTGHGIKPGDLERIYDPFFSTKPSGRGSGLGLAISKEIVESHGGRLSVTSQQGQGACFRVLLPAHRRRDTRPSAASPGAQSAEPGAARPRVLVVDDEPMMRRMLGRIGARRFEVELAESGEQARQVLESDSGFDLVLCDLMMPGFNGMDLYLWAQQHQPGTARRMLFMTGGAFTEKTAEFLDQIDGRYIEKPFGEKELLARVDAFMAQMDAAKK